MTNAFKFTASLLSSFCGSRFDKRNRLVGVTPSNMVLLLIVATLAIINVANATGGDGCTNLDGSQPEQSSPCPECGDWNDAGTSPDADSECTKDPIQLSRGAVIERATDAVL